MFIQPFLRVLTTITGGTGAEKRIIEGRDLQVLKGFSVGGFLTGLGTKEVMTVASKYFPGFCPIYSLTFKRNTILRFGMLCLAGPDLRPKAFILNLAVCFQIGLSF